MDADADRDAPLARLMAAAQQGDRIAYAELLRSITPMLRKLVRAKRGFLDRADIEDLVQDVLLSLHSVRATYDPGRPFLPWLMAVARNRIADGGRKYARTSANEVLVAEYPETFPGAEANSETDASDDREWLHAAIDTLPQGQKRAVQLLKLKEMSLKEASAASGMSVAALKVAVHRAMRALRLAMRSTG